MKTSPFSSHLNFLYFWPFPIFFFLFFIPYYCLMNARRPSPLINPWRTDLLPQHTCSVWISRLIEAILSFSWAVSPIINHMLGLDQISGVWTIRIRSDQFRIDSGIYCAFWLGLHRISGLFISGIRPDIRFRSRNVQLAEYPARKRLEKTLELKTEDN